LGAASAKGEIILFLDDDMMCEPAVVAEHARMYERGADAVLGRILIDPESIAGFLTDDAATFAESMLPQQSATGLDVFTGQFSVRRNVFEDIGGFDEGFTSQSALGMEDADFGVTLLARHRLVVNAAAVSYQRYVMTPRENMRRQRLWAAADLRFARKHPRLSEELFRSRGAGRLVTQVIYRPLSRVPGLSQGMSAAAVRISEWALGTGLRSNRLLARFFAVSRAIAYWHAVAANGGVPHENR
jgi:GT2 family glycosyltransferase